MIAIDPGLSGGVAWFDDEGQAHCMKMPVTETDLASFFHNAACANGKRVAIIEEPPLVIGTKISPASVGKLHRNLGFCLGSLAALSFRVELIKPRVWQSHFQLGSKRDTTGTTQWKNKLKAEAQRRFPTLDVTLATADALLILDYGKSQQ